MPENPYEPPKEVETPKPRVAIGLGHILREAASAFGCLAAAVLVVGAAMLLLSILGLGLEALSVKRE